MSEAPSDPYHGYDVEEATRTKLEAALAWTLACFGIYFLDGGLKSYVFVQRLYRVAGREESGATAGNGGRPVASPRGQEAKPFWTTRKQAEEYQVKVEKWDKDTVIWQWRNPNRVGELGPKLDFIPGPSHHIPNGQLPRVPPGKVIK